MQELPTAYQFPFRVNAMKPSVGRGHVPAACRNYQVCAVLFMPTVCRFAVLRDMSKPYRGCFVYRGAFFACGLRDRCAHYPQGVRRIRNAPSSRTAAHRSWQSPPVDLYALRSSYTGLPRRFAPRNDIQVSLFQIYIPRGALRHYSLFTIHRSLKCVVLRPSSLA